MPDTPSSGSPNHIVTEAAAHTTDAGRENYMQLFEEKLEVSKRLVEKGRVQVSTATHTHEQIVDELLAHEHVEIERIPIDRRIEAMPAVREEDDTIIVPVVEEVLKVERLLFLKEEVRIRRVKGTERFQDRITLRKQQAVVHRLPIDESTAVPAQPTEHTKENA